MNFSNFNFNKYLKVKILTLLIFLLNVPAYSQTTADLKHAEILGTEYYVYEVKKGDSLYGISKKFGWNLEELARLNPDANGKLSKGRQIYYPVSQASKTAETPKPKPQKEEPKIIQLEPLKHEVKKGENVYSISRQYGISPDLIYEFNPNSKKGIKAGEILEIPQNDTAKYYYYNVKSGDTLYSIAKTYGTTIEDILKNNAGLTVDNLKAGETIRITPNSVPQHVKTETVAEERVTQLNPYKVSKNETWDDISQKTGVGVDVLKEVNNSSENPAGNDIITVPVIESVEVEKTTVEVENIDDDRDLQGIYESVTGTSGSNLSEKINVALILDEPNSKKDIDFTRGAMVALSRLGEKNYKISFKVFDGRVSASELTRELEDFEPNLLISTADKTFPFFLADFGNTNHVQVINVFDLKNDLYEDNASMVQILPPTTHFTDRVASKIYQENRNRRIITVGTPDENDTFAIELMKLYGIQPDNFSIEELAEVTPDELENTLIYAYPNKKEELTEFFKTLDNLTRNQSDRPFKIVGRTNWVAFIDNFTDKYKEYGVVIPSRVWLDTSSNDWNEFSNEFVELFENAPVRSIPNFAASGYDMISYFVPLIISNKGDFNQQVNPKVHLLQNEMNLTRVNNWGGFVNTLGYVLKYKPQGPVEAVIVK